MFQPFLVAGIMAASVGAQASLASNGFQYVGCVQAKPCFFPLKMDLGDSFTITQCQQACGEKSSYAAAAGDGCHCEDAVSHAAPEYNVTDDSRCSRACKAGDEKAGRCGGLDAEEGHQLYNLYRRVSAHHAAPNVTAARSADETAVVATSTALSIVTTCAPDVVDCPARSKGDKSYTTPHTAEGHSSSYPVQTKTALACSNCTAPVSPSRAHYPCPGPECKETKIPLPPTSTAAAAAGTASGPSTSMIASDAGCRPGSAITVLLSMVALVLAVGMS
ncbi:Carbohydrate-binding WSC [Metarhizium rileyi]|uniref:Carbohydrate-binding WSC n=1 Tax=Metarhizium rileyi (strain RCEF 4871) TaxID=1649241 RepID=A0A166WGY8_METRR|nr:Carbohydrate-binding WSC [Metarhizium rileyi RCEF 4871]